MSHKARVEPPLTEEFQKNPRAEAFLEQLNDILEPYNEKEYQDKTEHYPTIYIVGVARSGTTLLHQLIASHLDVGYINNLIAAFWRAPLYGIRLSEKLGIRLSSPSFDSKFGRTQSVHEPHEFGYFWSELLGYREPQQRNPSDPDPVDWKRVRLILNAMTGEFGKPLVFKSLYAGWHITELHALLKHACFIRIRRDPAENAASLLRCRQEFSGSISNWVSLRPREYPWLSKELPSVQAVGQVYYLEQDMSRQIEEIKGQNVLEISYEQLCQDPVLVIETVRALLRRNGSDVSMLGTPPRHFDSRSSPAGSAMEEGIRKAVRHFYGSKNQR